MLYSEVKLICPKTELPLWLLYEKRRDNDRAKRSLRSSRNIRRISERQKFIADRKAYGVRKIKYIEDSDHWNKNMVKRIIENEKYLGTNKYPQLIDEDIFKRANEKRERKATTLNLISDDLREIRKVTYCAECGGKAYRKLTARVVNIGTVKILTALNLNIV